MTQFQASSGELSRQSTNFPQLRKIVDKTLDNSAIAEYNKNGPRMRIPRKTVEGVPEMTVAQINSQIASGKEIKICPWDSASTNQASATVLSVGEDRVVYYQVDGCEATVCRPVSLSTWRSIVEQTR
jgi:hypothetical protein